jgi:hypothetical protein
MSLTLEQIPRADAPSDETPPTAALTGVALPTRRRTVLRAITLGALTAGAMAADWSGRLLPHRPAFAASFESGPGGLVGWSNPANGCAEPYPNRSTYYNFQKTGYDEQADTSGSYTSYQAACFGGNFRSSGYCTSGWHKNGLINGQVYTPISTTCGFTQQKNAWRWRTSDGNTWRCSDGHTTSGTNVYFTICRARL